jgi:hypothetical protein
LLPAEDFAQLHGVFQAGGGATSLAVINSRSSVALITAVMNGDAAAKAVLAAADELPRRIERRSQATALRCMCCDDTALWRGEAPAAIGVLLPFGIDPVSTVAAMAICSSCADGRRSAEIAQSVIAALRSHMPDLREFHPVADVGHA